MSALLESARGLWALSRWFLGASFACAHLLLTAKTRKAAQALLAQRGETALATCRVKVEVSGEAPPPGHGCVLVYNETSFADSFAFQGVMWGYIDRSSGADIFAVIPFMRAACARSGIALVPRGSRAGTDRVLAEMVTAVKSGERVAWGGEGRMAGRDEVLRFKVGAALIAIRGGVPLVPVAFRGGHAVMPLRSARARAGTIHIRFGAPLPTTGLQEDDARALSDRAQAAVAAMFADL